MVCAPSTESLERKLSATCSIWPYKSKRYEKPDNVTASMYVAMAALLAVKQLPNESLAIYYFAVVPSSKVTFALLHSRLLGHYNGLPRAKCQF